MKALVRRSLASVGYRLVRAEPEPDIAEPYAGYARESINSALFYNFGAGDFDHPYWTNIDYASEWYASVQQKPFIAFDAMELRPLPIDSSSAEAFYSSHVIEHLSNDAVANVLREAFRCLKPGGFVRLVTPDAELEYRAYKRHDILFFNWAKRKRFAGKSLDRIFLNHFASQISRMEPTGDDPPQVADEEIRRVFDELPMEAAFDYFISRCRYDARHAGSHINWWTESKLGKMLADAGFKSIYRSGHGQSLCPPMRDLRYFDATNPNYFRISLYMEAIK